MSGSHRYKNSVTLFENETNKSSPGYSGYDSKKTSSIKEDICDTAIIMNENINKLKERGERLDQLEAHSQQLDQEALQFKKHAKNVKKRLWFENTKLLIAIIVIILLIALAITLVLCIPNTKPRI